MWLPWMLGCGLGEAAKGVVPGPDAGECQGLAGTGMQGRAALSMAKRIRHENGDRWVDDLPRLIDAEGALRPRGSSGLKDGCDAAWLAPQRDPRL